MLTSGSFPDRLAGVDLDLARLGLLQHRDADRQDTVVVRGVDAGRVQVLGEVDAAGVAAPRALAYEELLRLGGLLPAAGGGRQGVALGPGPPGNRGDGPP